MLQRNFLAPIKASVEIPLFNKNTKYCKSCLVALGAKVGDIEMVFLDMELDVGYPVGGVFTNVAEKLLGPVLTALLLHHAH